jgi:hypothetical protein
MRLDWSVHGVEVICRALFDRQRGLLYSAGRDGGTVCRAMSKEVADDQTGFLKRKDV